jgi:replicative DNA helicase
MTNNNIVTLNSSDSEMAIIGTMLLERSACNQVPRLIKPEDFFNTDNRNVYNALLTLITNKDEVSVLAAANELARTPETTHYDLTYLERYLDYSVSTADVLTFARQVAEYAGLRSLGAWHSGFMNEVAKGDSLLELTTEMLRVGRDLSLKGVTSRLATGIALREELIEFLDKEKNTSSMLGIKELDDNLYDFQETEVVVIAARPGVGKALPDNELVLTPQGWRHHGTLRVGESVIGSDGKPTKVLGVYPQKGGCDTYLLKLKHGGSVRCSADHIWSVMGFSSDYFTTEKDALDAQFKVTTLELKNLVDLPYLPPLYLPVLTEPFEYDIPVNHTFEEGYTVGMNYLNPDFPNSSPTAGYIQVESLEFRRGYLAGLLTVRADIGVPKKDPDGEYRLSTKFVTVEVPTKEAAEALCTLVYGLAGHAYVGSGLTSHRKHAPFYEHFVNIYYLHDHRAYNAAQFLPFDLDMRSYNTRKGREIESITYLGSNVPSTCIKVEARDSLYIVRDYIITHNTTFATQSAAHQAVALNKKVGFLSMEMIKPKLLIRMLAALLGINNRELGEMSSAKLLTTPGASEYLDALTKNCIIEDSGPFTVDSVMSKLYSMYYEFGAEVLYIDYLGLIGANNEKGGNRQDHIAATSRRIKEFAMDTKTKVVLMSQLNRAVEGRASNRPILSDLRESGAVEQDASIIIFLYPNLAAIGASTGSEEMSSADLEAYLENNAEIPLIIDVAKQRNGPKFPIEVTSQQPYSRFISKGSNRVRFQKKTVMDDDGDGDDEHRVF